MMGEVPADTKIVKTMSKKQFMKELKTTGRAIKDFYSKIRINSKTHFSVKQRPPLIFLTFANHFTQNGENKIEHRYILFYKPKYRLTLIVIGNEKYLKSSNPILRPNIEQFFEDLARIYPHGLTFSNQSKKLNPDLTE